MTKKTKLTKKEIIDKTIETVNYLVVPVAAVAAIWGVDISVYCAAAGGATASVLEFVKLFVK
jgi:hypothetical protein